MAEQDAEQVVVEDVVVVSDGPVLVCETQGRRFGIPPAYIGPGSEVYAAGDRGRLVLPGQVARNLGLT